MQTVLLEQLDRAIEPLEREPPAPVELEREVHEIRKTLKRLRALLRVSRETLGPKRFERENATLRECGRRLAGARDAAVMAQTLRGLVKRYPDELSRSRAVTALLAELESERERATTQVLGVRTTRTEVLAELQGVRRRLAGWSARERKDKGAVDPARSLDSALRDLYRQGRRRDRRSRERYKVRGWHSWRKRVKDLRYVAETLAEHDLADARPSGNPTAPSTKRLRKVAARADRLGELLGEEHDLALLAELVEDRARHFDGERATQRSLSCSIAHRRRRLRKKALRAGARLYGDPPGRFVRKLRPS